MESKHLSFEVPPGPQALELTVVSGWAALSNLRFIFSGKPQAFRITEILETRCAEMRISFADATPHEVTVFFAQNPQPPTQSGTFRIQVKNQSASAETLLVTTMYDLTTPVCAL